MQTSSSPRTPTTPIEIHVEIEVRRDADDEPADHQRPDVSHGPQFGRQSPTSPSLPPQLPLISTNSSIMSLPRSSYDPRRVCLNPFPEFTLGKHRRTIGVYLAGALFALANWTFLDAAILSAHAKKPLDPPPPVHVTFVDWVPGICSLLGFFVIVLIDKDRVRGEEGFGDSRAVWRARLFLFIGFALMAGGLAGSITVLILKYILEEYPEQFTYYGYANVSQNVALMLSAVVLWIATSSASDWKLPFDSSRGRRNKSTIIFRCVTLRLPALGTPARISISRFFPASHNIAEKILSWTTGARTNHCSTAHDYKPTFQDKVSMLGLEITVSVVARLPLPSTFPIDLVLDLVGQTIQESSERSSKRIVGKIFGGESLNPYRQ
ncbi:hypothetical protein CCMSSC00406_0009351 [Pleurotus cornucopiae]|uniref:Uncharacterized protein n=1 Tax=Pleurotus cornucopiae TaxID=5321 RepID=A0ACB7ITH7_PLECO|nr:hypothetical protein CCMSSC00406_0009351 [Pleurotus cornucopiae]